MKTKNRSSKKIIKWKYKISHIEQPKMAVFLNKKNESRRNSYSRDEICEDSKGRYVFFSAQSRPSVLRRQSGYVIPFRTLVSSWYNPYHHTMPGYMPRALFASFLLRLVKDRIHVPYHSGTLHTPCIYKGAYYPLFLA